MVAKLWRVGDLAVVNRRSDATVYQIKLIDGFMAHLQYRVLEEMVSGGAVDVSVLMVPTKKQLKANPRPGIEDCN